MSLDVALLLVEEFLFPDVLLARAVFFVAFCLKCDFRCAGEEGALSLGERDDMLSTLQKCKETVFESFPQERYRLSFARPGKGLANKIIDYCLQFV
ncbi:hypothetical protein XV93_01300 [Vibrio metoecus]|uniref:Uncharacterized protein n=1 Tax=Vibrio metoecus TaxID=1481663 RepID=A0A067B3F2_VIBMT|nr:hypothetical protein DP83_13950 [Vibrio metoecus]KQA24714.1 hypothetical protein AAY55_01405 [Vibrio metoecus]KQB01102.1 hypothetical protein XV91_06765 [Vibrio metoecus]KQB07785.1 hypothetical protein XV93_01300 [Vibrio metoecus]